MTISALHQVTLADGRRITLRPAAPDDEHALTVFFEDLDAESRRLRFHQPVPIVKPWLVRQLVAIDQVDHVSWLAWCERRVVGEARYVRSRTRHDEAEVAFAVAPDFRRVGLGRLLVETLGLVARRDGIEVFTSTVGHDNRASAALLQALGAHFRFGDGALEGTGPVPDWSRGPDLAAEALARHDDAIHVTAQAA